MPLPVKPLDPATTAAISIGTSIVTTLVTTFIKGKVEKKQKDAEKTETKIADRLNVDKNIRREYMTSRIDTGSWQIKKWLVNPYWIDFEGGFKPTLRGWPNHRLTQRVGFEQGEYGTKEVMGDLLAGTVDDAKQRREWLKMWEDSDGLLRFQEPEPCAADDVFLFQPLPPEKKRGLLPWGRK